MGKLHEYVRHGCDWAWSCGGETVLDVTKDSILTENTRALPSSRSWRRRTTSSPVKLALSELETDARSTVETSAARRAPRRARQAGSEWGTYDRMYRSDYLYTVLSGLAATEGSSLYATDSRLCRRAGLRTPLHPAAHARVHLSGTGPKPEEGALAEIKARTGRLHGRRSDWLLSPRLTSTATPAAATPRATIFGSRSDGRGV